MALTATSFKTEPPAYLLIMIYRFSSKMLMTKMASTLTTKEVY